MNELNLSFDAVTLREETNMKDLRLTRQGDTQWILWDGPKMVAYVLDRNGTVVVNMAEEEEEEEEESFLADLDHAQDEVEAEQAEDYLGEATCPTCSAENLPMGILGRTVHYRCRACGMGYSLTMTEAAWEAYVASREAE